MPAAKPGRFPYALPEQLVRTSTDNLIHFTLRGAKLVLVVALLALPGCEQRSEEEQISSAVARFHELYNEQRFDDIYSDAGSLYRRKISRADHNRLLALQHREFGRVTMSERGRIKISRSAGLTVIAVLYMTQFQRGAASEFFGLRIGITEPGIKLVDYSREFDGVLPRK